MKCSDIYGEKHILPLDSTGAGKWWHNSEIQWLSHIPMWQTWTPAFLVSSSAICYCFMGDNNYNAREGSYCKEVTTFIDTKSHYAGQIKLYVYIIRAKKMLPVSHWLVQCGLIYVRNELASCEFRPMDDRQRRHPNVRAKRPNSSVNARTAVKTTRGPHGGLNECTRKRLTGSVRNSTAPTVKGSRNSTHWNCVDSSLPNKWFN